MEERRRETNRMQWRVDDCVHECLPTEEITEGVAMVLRRRCPKRSHIRIVLSPPLEIRYTSSKRI